jgi:hypothetical protein
MDDGERDVAEKSFPAEPEQSGRILSHRPKQSNIFESIISFPDDIDALILQFG